MGCPCQKDIKDLENILKRDGESLPEPTKGLKILSVIANILSYMICLSLAILLFPILFAYILLSGIFSLNTSISTKKIVKFLKIFG